MNPPYRFFAVLGTAFSLIGANTILAQGPQPLPVAKGVYRLPFADGTDVGFSNDHTNHPASLNRIDMTAAGGAFGTVVAAGAGWVRIIVENNDTKCPNANNDPDGDGVVTVAENNAAQLSACGGYSGPSSFCCERDFEANGGNCPGAGTCLGTPNNFVWIEHPNGEWTKYTHMQRGSVGTGMDNNGNPGAGRVQDEFVTAGTPLGIEGDVGFAGGPHVHFEVAVPNHVQLPPPNATEDDPDSPPDTVNDWFSGGFLVSDGVLDDVLFEDTDGDGINDPDDDVDRQNRIAFFCQLGLPMGGGNAAAGVCDDPCGNDDLELSGTITPGESPFYQQATDTVGNPNGALVIQANAGVALRAGQRVTLSPGFHAELNSFFAASIGGCDSPGGTDGQ